MKKLYMTSSLLLVALLLLSIKIEAAWDDARPVNDDAIHRLTASGSSNDELSNESTTPLPLHMYPTIESAGIVSPFSGDENGNNRAVIYYRSVGSSTWQEGPAMSRDDTAHEWRVSIVHLLPDTQYEVEVRYQDADGVSPETVPGTLRTRPDYPEIGENGTIRTVSSDESLQAVIDSARPGDTIRLLSGIYHPAGITLWPSHSGEPGQYITIEPAPGAKVIFDGSDPGINSDHDDWAFLANSAYGDIYYIDLPWGATNCDAPTPGYVGELVQQSGIRYLLFDSGSNNWENDFLPSPAGKAFYVCDGSGPGPVGRLYVVTYSGDDPDNHEMHVSRHLQAFRLKGADHIRIRGIEFRYYSRYAIEISHNNESGSDHDIVEDNIFHGNGQGHISMKGKLGHALVSNNLIQNNHFYEKGYRDSRWQWKVYYHDAHGYTVAVRLSDTGHGNVIRGNRFDSGHDGIHINGHSHDVDVYDNTISEYMDDGIEIDNEPGQNIRVWNNAINYCYVGISLQDWNGQSQGPAYIFRNVIVGGEDPQGRTDHTGGKTGYASYTTFKVGSDLTPDGWTYIYHNTISLTRSSRTGTGLQNSGGAYFANAVTRNNIWHVTGHVFRLETVTAIVNHDTDCDNLHDLEPNDQKFVEWSQSGGPSGDGIYHNLADFQSYTDQQLHGVSDASTVFDPEMQLEAGSPDIDAGCIIKGFNNQGPNAYLGSAPDIGAFEYTGYGFVLNALPPSHAIDPGGVAKYTLSVQPLGGFTHTVSLVSAPPPPSLTLSLHPTTITPPGQAALTLSDSHEGILPSGLWYKLPITATGGGITQTMNVSLLVGGARFYLPLISQQYPRR